jgi:diguanylate cyclase (GGDEF)-like protein
MAEGQRSVRIVTSDEVLMASARSAVRGLDGWALVQLSTVEELLTGAAVPGDVILLDAWFKHGNVYEACRRLTGNTRCRTFVVVEEGNRLAEPIAQFCGATGVVTRPLTGTKLRAAFEMSAPRPTLPHESRGEVGEPALPERMLKDLGTSPDSSLIQALIDPETSLYNYEFLSFKLEEEFKRAKRFGTSLACVMLGFEGQASKKVLGELAGVFLQTSRDTDIMGRFDESSFLFILPSTGPDGAEVMARRIRSLAEHLGLRDLTGDPLQLAVGISCYPHAQVTRREDLYSGAREAYFSARAEGGGLVRAR